MSSLSLNDRIKGCLVGSAIGAELGFARTLAVEKDGYKAGTGPENVFTLDIEPVLDYKGDRGRETFGNARAFIDLGARAYITKNGRVTPEDFGALLKDDEAIAMPPIFFDPIHTTQELLIEGMNPRLSGIGNVPCGYIAASMPAVGIYHFSDAEYAYLDGVELASVNQPRLGADWAALCAVAVAAALDPNSTAESVVDIVLKIAHQNNKELFYVLNNHVNITRHYHTDCSEEDFIAWWYYNGSRQDRRNDTNYWIYNPISCVLPLLKYYGNDSEKMMSLLMAAPQAICIVSAEIAGAILGAMHGVDAFPDKWRKWAEPIASPWMPITDVVSNRITKERKVISVVDSLSGSNGVQGSMLFDKVYGCILAGAIGNAMGSPVESKFYWEIDEQYPGGVTTVLDPKRLESEDDNQMAMFLVETYLDQAGSPVTARHFGKTWYESLNRDHFFVNCMGHCYDLIRLGWDPRITGHWTEVTGSAVMCMEPVGIYHIADPENAYIDAKAVSYMYQRGLDNTIASILAATVAEAFRPDATVDSVCQVALEVAPREPLRTFDKRSFNSVYDYLEACLAIADKYDDVMAVRPELYEKCLLYSPIDPLELFGFSLAILKVAKGDIRQSAVGGTNIGRDADTIAGRAAMLAGILNGGSSVPQEWIDLFSRESLDRIQKNSRRLVEFLEIKNNRLKYRQSVAY